LNLPAGAPDVHRYLAAGRRMAERVAEQVPQYLR
jgi:hypothetical protein